VASFAYDAVWHRGGHQFGLFLIAAPHSVLTWASGACVVVLHSYAKMTEQIQRSWTGYPETLCRHLPFSGGGQLFRGN